MSAAGDRRMNRNSITVEEVEYSVGDTVKLVGRQYGHLRPGDLSKVTDITPGTFSGDVYVFTVTDEGEKAGGFDWRFEKV